MNNAPLITPVILSGGAGTRLWPMSTADIPKQFLALTDSLTMFQLTAKRAADTSRFAPPIIVANARHAALIESQLAAIGITPGAIILEPCARNTAPAIALAAVHAGPDANLLVMPSDHVIANEPAFVAAILVALPFAHQGWLATFGIKATGPETGYGYIQTGTLLADGVHRVKAFREKPDAERAAQMIADGDHVWNGGIFLFGAAAFLSALDEHAPAIADAAHAAMAGATHQGALIRPDADAFAASPSDSIDFALMEKAARVAVVPVNMGWSDVGSWDALYELGTKDAAANCLSENVRLLEGSGNLIHSDGIKISISGLDNLIVIASGNDVMILPRGSSQDAKKFSA